MMYLVILVILLGVLLRHLNKPRKPAILSMYQQKNAFYYMKYALMFSVLKLRQVIGKTHSKNSKSLIQKSLDIDRPQALHNHPLAIDAVYFNATSRNGAALVCGVARRPDQICNAFLYLRIEGGQLMLSPELPDTTLKQETNEENYHVAGIKIDVLEPMKNWKIQYEGPMKFHNDLSKTVIVKLDANFESDKKYFNYDTDMSASGMSMAMAREMWSSEYFNTLQRVHQTHYEQHGQINGKVIIDGVEHNLSVDCVRDHTFGKYREWKNFHRYGLHFINLANGDYITVGKICMPICFSNLTVGFICKKDSKKNFPVTFCDLELYQHGENLVPPKDYAFQFHADGTQYTVQVDVIDSPTFYIGKERECRVVERLAKFVVNGVEGWGAAEWQYRNMGEKNDM